VIAAWISAFLGAAIAGACASADGAILSLDPAEALPPRLRALYERREHSHRALAFARVMAQLSAGVAVAIGLGLGDDSAGSALWKGAAAALALVGISEALARSLGTVHGTQTATRLYPFIVLVERVLAPIAWLGAWFDQLLHRLLPPPLSSDAEMATTAEQFRQVVASEADVSKDQEVLLNGVFRLGQTEVQEIMVPRVDIVGIDRDSPWSEVVDRVRSSEHARFPVYADSIDNVIGILFAKDLLPAVVADEVPDDWTTLVRPAVFIPGAKNADVQLRDFQATRTHIAIVADEFGGTAGLITIEDVLEEIVGDIRDEYDEDEPVAESEEDTRYWLSARMTLDELSELVGHTFQREDVSTVGGLVYEVLGRVPRAGEELIFDGFRVVVEKVVRRRVTRVFLERLPTAGNGDFMERET
jgi:putative hemolysin